MSEEIKCSSISFSSSAAFSTISAFNLNPSNWRNHPLKRSSLHQCTTILHFTGNRIIQIVKAVLADGRWSMDMTSLFVITFISWLVSLILFLIFLHNFLTLEEHVGAEYFSVTLSMMSWLHWPPWSVPALLDEHSLRVVLQMYLLFQEWSLLLQCWHLLDSFGWYMDAWQVVLSHLLETQSQVLDALSGSSMPSSICWIVLACPLRMMKIRQYTLLTKCSLTLPELDRFWSTIPANFWIACWSWCCLQLQRDSMPLFDSIGVNSGLDFFNLFVITTNSLNSREISSQNLSAFLSVLCFALHKHSWTLL